MGKCYCVVQFHFCDSVIGCRIILDNGTVPFNRHSTCEGFALGWENLKSDLYDRKAVHFLISHEI